MSIVDDSAGAVPLPLVQELRELGALLGRVDLAAADTEWTDGRALDAVISYAEAELADVTRTARRLPPDPIDPGHPATGTVTDPVTDAAAALSRARTAVAEAVLAVAATRGIDSASAPRSRLNPVRRVPAAVSDLGLHTRAEIRHILTDSPRAVLHRIVITLGIALSIVAFYHFTGMAEYDAARLTLYLFSAVVGSVVCTNALCFEAGRVRRALGGGDHLWRLLVTKNLAMGTLITVAALPVIGLLTVLGDGHPVAMLDQLLTMVLIWLGVGNVLSVVYPLRHEPVSARRSDGTLIPYLVSFAVSYGVGLTVNLMIYWRLWSRHTATHELTGGDWAAFALVLASAFTSWLLLTVFAVACSRDPHIRQVLSRELIPYRRD